MAFKAGRSAVSTAPQTTAKAIENCTARFIKLLHKLRQNYRDSIVFRAASICSCVGFCTLSSNYATFRLAAALWWCLAAVVSRRELEVEFAMPHSNVCIPTPPLLSLQDGQPRHGAWQDAQSAITANDPGLGSRPANVGIKALEVYIAKHYVSMRGSVRVAACCDMLSKGPARRLAAYTLDAGWHPLCRLEASVLG